MRKLGYEAFGSFHSESIETLLRNVQSAYIDKPFSTKKQKFRFVLDTKNWTFLNHGAFGGCTENTLNASHEWRKYIESQPLRGIDRILFPHLIQSLHKLSKFVNCAVDDIVMVPNATFGLNAVLTSIAAAQVEASDVLYFDTTYGSVKHMIHHGHFKQKFELKIIGTRNQWKDLQGEAQRNFILEAFKRKVNVLKAGSVVVLDHVASNTGIVFPIKEMILYCKQREITVVVDGAHGLLNLDLHLEELQADYYVGNCHKWGCSGKGVGFLYVHPNAMVGKENISSPIVSHGVHAGFTSRFLWTGLMDYSNQLALLDTLMEWEEYGVHKARKYMHDIVARNANRLQQMWNTEMFVKPELISAMALVRLPLKMNKTYSSSDGKLIQDYLYEECKIEVPIKCIDGELYVRISGHVYNRDEEYDQLGKVLMDNHSVIDLLF